MAIINNTPPSHIINDTTPQSTNTNHILITERKSNISENQNDILISTSLHYIFLGLDIEIQISIEVILLGN